MVVANLAPFVSARSPRFGASGVTPGCFLFFCFGLPLVRALPVPPPVHEPTWKGRNGDLRGPARRRGDGQVMSLCPSLGHSPKG